MTFAANITAFHFLGGALAIWAVVLAALGVLRPDFPPKGGDRIVIAISALLVASTIVAAITQGENTKKTAAVAGGNAGQSPGGNAQQQPGQASAQTLTLSADPSGALKFDKTTLQAKKGVVKLVLNNPAPLPHNISIQGPGGIQQQGPTVSKGGASQVTVTLKPGSYTYYCAVPGHRQAGMQGTLTVK